MASLIEAVNRLDATRADIKRLARDKHDGWQGRYAELRLHLQDCVEGVRRAAASRADWAELARKAEEAKTRLARHQARWPVLIIKAGNESYAASMQALDELFDELSRDARKLG